jgi:type IV secretion system protein VirB3
MSGTIGTNPLFLGLTRPPLIVGVSYTFAALNGIISVLAFIITSSFIYLFVVLPFIHMIGWFICLKEPRAIELAIAKFSKCNICRNRYYYGNVNSYDVY